jgi:hypothetical protein
MKGMIPSSRTRVPVRHGARLAGAAASALMVSAAGADPVLFPGTGHYYEIVVTPDVGWLVARDAAVARGGYLATVASADENAFLLSLILDTPDAWYVLQNRRAIGPWLGGYQPKGIRPADEGWLWSNGEAWSYTNWSPGQPDNDDLGESFVHFSNLGTVLDGTWNDRAQDDNNRDTGYIVEYNENPCAVINLQPTSKSICPGQRAVFTVRAFSPFPMSFQWYHNGSPLEDSDKYAGAHTSRLTVRDARDADEGIYYCVIENSCSPQASDFVRLNVAVPGDLTGSDDPFDPEYGVPDGVADAKDGTYFIQQFEARNQPVVDLTGSSDPNDPAYGSPDGLMDASDYFYFLDQTVRGCPEPPNESADDGATTPEAAPAAIISQVPAPGAPGAQAEKSEKPGRSPWLVRRPAKRDAQGTGETITGKSQRGKAGRPR